MVIHEKHPNVLQYKESKHMQIRLLIGLFLNYFFQEIPLRPGSDIAKAWKNPPITPYLKLYFFNVTNHEDFLVNGSKPILKEIGPFIYS